MNDNDSAAEKGIVNELNFGEKTAKRVAWEAWEFTVVGPHQIKVTNASWGHLKDQHSYIVGVEERDGRPVPAECGCKADRFRDDYDCKHKVALAAVGNSVVLQAALDCPTPTVDTDCSASLTLADRLRTDGGTVAAESLDDSPSLNEVDQECGCSKDFPCFECYRVGRRNLPE